MSDCCSSPPSLGLWKIYVKTPIYYPARVIFNWNDGSGQQQIKGDDYIISSEQKTYPNVYYNVTIKQTWYRRDLIDGYNNGPWTTNGIIEIFTRYNILGNIGGLKYFNNDPNNSFGLYYNNNLEFWGIVSGYQTIHWPVRPSYVTTAADHQVVDISRVDGQPPDKDWTLKIFNKQDKIYEQTKPTQPTAELKPEQCLQNEQKTFVRDYQNWKSQDYCSQIIQGNQNSLLLYSEQRNGLFLPLSLAYASSPEQCSLAPIFEVDCIPCRQCPEGSCQVICGDRVCCYDPETGESINSFSIEELC